MPFAIAKGRNVPTADIILKNANVITMDPKQPAAELVVVKGDRILWVGSNKELDSFLGAKTRVIDCQGKTVVPGFNDAHCHIFSSVKGYLSVDLSPSSVNSIADIKAAINRSVQTTPAGGWIIGAGYNEFYLAEKRHPNRWDIDEIAPNHPIVLTHRSLHACVLNSLALSLAGINKETPEPPSGLIDRDSDSGELTGLLFEMLAYVRGKVLPPLSEKELNRGIALANRHYLSCGITSLQDATVTNDLGRWQILRQLKEAGKLESRVSMMAGLHALPQFREAGLVPGSGDNHLRLYAAKIMLRETNGKLYPLPQELSHQILQAYRAGFQVAIHAVGQCEVEAAIIALERTHRCLPQADWRPRIEHCSECPPYLFERLCKLRAVIVTQPPFLYYSGDRYLATIPPNHLPWLYRIKSFLDSSLVVAGSSDSPVVGDNPLIGIYAAVTRQTEAGQPIQPEEHILPLQALGMYTSNAAYASSEEGIKGSLTQGKLSDMVVLSADPLKSHAEKIKDIKVEMTIIGGKVAWED